MRITRTGLRLAIVTLTALVAIEGVSATAASAAAVSGDNLATTAPTSQRAGIIDLVNDFLFCSDARLDTMYPAAPFFVFDCMRGAPGSNG